jgi:hypothetical protein
MKTAIRLLLGILSSLLLAVGFANAAERFDVVSSHSVTVENPLPLMPCIACELPGGGGTGGGGGGGLIRTDANQG